MSDRTQEQDGAMPVRGRTFRVRYGRVLHVADHMTNLPELVMPFSKERLPAIQMLTALCGARCESPKPLSFCEEVGRYPLCWKCEAALAAAPDQEGR